MLNFLRKKEVFTKQLLTILQKSKRNLLSFLQVQRQDIWDFQVSSVYVEVAFRRVAIVGGGDTAAEEATYLANICEHVTMLVRKDEMRASKAMQHRVNSRKNITVLYNTEVEEVIGEQVVEGLKMINNQTKETSQIEITGLFIAIGHKPNTDIFKGQLEMDDTGYIITEAKSTKTGKPGVFASGDVQDKEYRQAITAAGTGCMAALDAERYLASIEEKVEA